MAKIAYSKLKLKVNEEITTLQLSDEITIEVRQYLPIQEKLALISRVAERAHEQDNNYSNPVKAKVYTELELIFNYTNISFTEKQLEDIPKLYDQLFSSGVLWIILNEIPQTEKDMIINGVDETIKSIYSYQNSAQGILDTLQANKETANFDVKELKESIKELSNSPLVKEIIPLLGLE